MISLNVARFGHSGQKPPQRDRVTGLQKELHFKLKERFIQSFIMTEKIRRFQFFLPARGNSKRNYYLEEYLISPFVFNATLC